MSAASSSSQVPEGVVADGFYQKGTDPAFDPGLHNQPKSGRTSQS